MHRVRRCLRPSIPAHRDPKHDIARSSGENPIRYPRAQRSAARKSTSTNNFKHHARRSGSRLSGMRAPKNDIAKIQHTRQQHKVEDDINTSRTDDQLLTRQHAQTKFWSMREADFHALARSLRSNADADVRCDDRAWRDPGSTRTDAKGVVWVRPKRVHGVQNAIYIGARRVNFADRAPRIVSSIRSRLPVPENKDQLTTVVVRISRPCRGHNNKACQA